MERERSPISFASVESSRFEYYIQNSTEWVPILALPTRLVRHLHIDAAAATGDPVVYHTDNFRVLLHGSNFPTQTKRTCEGVPNELRRSSSNPSPYVALAGNRIPAEPKVCPCENDEEGSSRCWSCTGWHAAGAQGCGGDSLQQLPKWQSLSRSTWSNLLPSSSVGV